jgi:outer membrane protein assembly factor BamB
MIHWNHVRILLLVAFVALSAKAAVLTARPQEPTQANTTVHLRWGTRPGVVRYRLQLANDSTFRDIVFDRVINGHETTVDDLAPGRYFWRVASLTTKLGDFSSAGVVEVQAQSGTAGPTNDRNKPAVVSNDSIKATGGWRAAIGDISQPVIAHLHSSDRFDVVGTNSDGVTYALDAATGVALWSMRPRVIAQKGLAPGAPLVISTRAGLADVAIFSGTDLSRIEGSTGRELWRTDLPLPVTSAVVLSDSTLVLVDTSLQRLMIVDSLDGRLMAQANLPARVIRAPVSLPFQKGFMLAYDTGRVELRDSAGALLRSGDAGSPATTAPIFVRSVTSELILVGTRAGLTALTGDLRPLGRVALKNDAPRGILMAQDLDGDGNVEVIMNTLRGHVVAVNAKDGRILWDVATDLQAVSFAFADINNDHVLDVFVAGGQSFASALSGRDGATVWKESPSFPIANHVTGGDSRALATVPFGSGALLIGGDTSRAGLRAIGFSRAEIRPNPR